MLAANITSASPTNPNIAKGSCKVRGMVAEEPNFINDVYKHSQYLNRPARASEEVNTVFTNLHGT